MNQKNLATVLLVVLGVGGVPCTSALAQESEGTYARFSRPDGQMVRSRRLAGQLMNLMGMSEWEWQMLVPKIDKVYVLTQVSEDGGGDGRPGASDANPGWPTPLSEASRDFRRALLVKETSAEDIKAKLQKLREEKEKIRAELTAARAELKAAVNARQEAVLVLYDLLD